MLELLVVIGLRWKIGREDPAIDVEAGLAARRSDRSATLEVSRIGHALRRAEDLPSGVAAVIEAEAGGPGPGPW